MKIKKIDGIYRRVKTVLLRTENKKRLYWGTILGVILGLIISLLIVSLSITKNVKALEVANGDGILFYAASGNATPQWRTYSNSTNDFSANSDTVAGAQPAINQIKTSPTKQEAIAGYQDTSGNLRVLCYNGTNWSQDWTIAVAASGTPTTRRFDIAYETNTGDVTVAYSRNTAAVNALAYRTKTGSSGCGSANWAAAANFPTTTTATSATVLWVKAARDGRSAQNLSAWIWLDNAATNADLGGAIWNGSAFTNFKSIETSMEHQSAVGDSDNFDVQSESISGEYMVVWGNSAGASGTNGYRYMTCTGGTSACTWSALSTLSGPLDEVMAIDLSADPLTDRMAMAGIGGASFDMSAGYWSGSGWTGYANVDTTCETTVSVGSKKVTTGWLNNNGNRKWYISYDDASGTGIGYKYAIDNGAISSPSDYSSTPALTDLRGRYDTDVNPFNNAELIQTISDDTNNIFAYKLSMDTSGNLSWSNTASASSLGTKPNHPQQGFAFTYWRYIPSFVITVSSTGSQTASMNVPSSNNYVGGAFTFSRNTGSANVTQIIVSETGDVNANVNLSNLKLFYKQEASCSTSIPGDATAFNAVGVGFDASENATASGTMNVGTSQICVYAQLDVGPGASNGQLLDLEITNPSTEVSISSGTVSPATAVTIAGSTTLQVTNQNPSSPSSLTQKTSPGDVAITESAWTIDNTPNFGFTVNDPDTGDTVKYEVQVATDSGFSSLVLDYTHGSLSANGTTFAFTIGSYGSGSCSGTCPATLSDSSGGYYWRVKGIDNSSASSSYVEFGSIGTMDLKVDATAPTGGSVVNDTNTGSLTQLGATWNSFNADVSGLLKYQYAVGTTTGGSDIKTWTDNGTSTSATASGLNLQTSTDYYFSVKAFDNAGNTGNAVSASAQQVKPTISYSIGSNTINFTNLNAGNSWTDTKTNSLNVQTNANNGYVVRSYITQALTSLDYPAKTINNYSASWSNPTNWSGYGFGYTSNDDDVQGQNRFGGSTKYCGFLQTPAGDIVADHTAIINGSTGNANDNWTITYKVATPASQDATTYQTTGYFIVIPNF